MDSLLTTNNMGYAKDIFGSPEYNEKYGIFYFASGLSEKIVTYFYIKNEQEKQMVIGALVAGDNDSRNLKHGRLSFEFDGQGLVTLSWVNPEGRQTVTFNEIELLQLMDIHWVRSLVKNRKAKNQSKSE